MSALSGFNNVLIKFLDKIIKWYPDMKDMSSIRAGIETLKKYNPRLVLDQFMGYIGRYFVQIFNKEESFFTDLRNLKNDPNIAKNTTDSIMLKMGSFKDIWTGIDDTRKIYIWKMFGVLLRVGALASTDPQYKVILEYIQDNPHLLNKK